MINIFSSPPVVGGFKSWFVARCPMHHITPFSKNQLILKVEGWIINVDIFGNFPKWP